VENFKKSVLNAGGEVLGLYLPEVKKYLTYSVKNFKKTVLQAGGETHVAYSKSEGSTSTHKAGAKKHSLGHKKYYFHIT